MSSDKVQKVDLPADIMLICSSFTLIYCMHSVYCGVATSQTMPWDSNGTIRFYTQKELGGFRGIHRWVILLVIQIATIALRLAFLCPVAIDNDISTDD